MWSQYKVRNEVVLLGSIINLITSFNYNFLYILTLCMENNYDNIIIWVSTFTSRSYHYSSQKRDDKIAIWKKLEGADISLLNAILSIVDGAHLYTVSASVTLCTFQNPYIIIQYRICLIWIHYTYYRIDDHTL